jgi:hypothetical protein
VAWLEADYPCPMKRVVEVELEDASIAVTYDREALIRAMAERASPAAFLGQIYAETSVTIDTLADALVSWDIAEDDGRPYPVNRESLAQLPIWVVFKINQAVTEDAFEAD